VKLFPFLFNSVLLSIRHDVTALLCHPNHCALSVVSEVAGVRIGFGYVWGSEVSARRPHQNAFPVHQISYRRTFCRIYQHCMDGSRMRKTETIRDTRVG